MGPLALPGFIPIFSPLAVWPRLGIAIGCPFLFVCLDLVPEMGCLTSSVKPREMISTFRHHVLLCFFILFFRGIKLCFLMPFRPIPSGEGIGLSTLLDYGVSRWVRFTRGRPAFFKAFRLPDHKLFFLLLPQGDHRNLCARLSPYFFSAVRVLRACVR